MAQRQAKRMAVGALVLSSLPSRMAFMALRRALQRASEGGIRNAALALAEEQRRRAFEDAQVRRLAQERQLAAVR